MAKNIKAGNENKRIDELKGNEEKMNESKTTIIAGNTITRTRETQQERETRKAIEWEESKANLQANLLKNYTEKNIRLLSKKNFLGNELKFKEYVQAVKNLSDYMYPFGYAMVHGLNKAPTTKEVSTAFELWKSVLAYTNTEEVTAKASRNDFALLMGLSMKVCRLFGKESLLDYNQKGVDTFRKELELIIVKRVNNIAGLTMEEQKQAKEERKQAKKAKREEERKNKKQEELKKQEEVKKEEEVKVANT